MEGLRGRSWSMVRVTARALPSMDMEFVLVVDMRHLYDGTFVGRGSAC